jgi:hypothetical protein
VHSRRCIQPTDSRTCTECNESPGEWNAKLGGIRLSLLCVCCEWGKTDEPVSLANLGVISACPGDVFAEVSRCGWMGYEVDRWLPAGMQFALNRWYLEWNKLLRSSRSRLSGSSSSRLHFQGSGNTFCWLCPSCACCEQGENERTFVLRANHAEENSRVPVGTTHQQPKHFPNPLRSGKRDSHEDML